MVYTGVARKLWAFMVSYMLVEEARRGGQVGRPGGTRWGDEEGEEEEEEEAEGEEEGGEGEEKGRGRGRRRRRGISEGGF